jgi:hypothetical protein
MEVKHVDLTNKEAREAFLARNSVPSPERERARRYQKSLYRWFDENREQIISGHYNEIALLRDNAVLGYYPDTKAAVSAALKTGLQHGDFLAQDCIPSDQEIELHVGFQIYG